MYYTVSVLQMISRLLPTSGLLTYANAKANPVGLLEDKSERQRRAVFHLKVYQIGCFLLSPSPHRISLKGKKNNMTTCGLCKE